MLIMGAILMGLVWVLDVPSWLAKDSLLDYHWFVGIGFAFGAACCFATALWITEHKLVSLAGPVRSIYTIGIVLILILFLSSTSVIEGGMELPLTLKAGQPLCSLGFSIPVLSLVYSCLRLNSTWPLTLLP
ncbi:hypothetical protein L1889_14260 [Paenalcaligenes niemegkensis]|nr:hypothetical protein [Paenalcaligenes niemegkensis]MCQ9617699.1 hypothetical protein [Paenalcaligenes niemegkensis]